MRLCFRSIYLPAALTALVLVAQGLVVASARAQVPQPHSPSPSFKSLDANGDGRVSLEEVMAYAKKKSGDLAPFSIKDVDLDGDGRLTPEEFKKAGIKGFEGQGVINVKDLDIHGDGYVSREDLDEYFRRKHREEYARADTDKDGALRQSEFALFRF